MNPIILTLLGTLVEAAKPEFLAAIKKLREKGALTDEEIAATEAKGKVTLEQMELDAGIDRL